MKKKKIMVLSIIALCCIFFWLFSLDKNNQDRPQVDQNAGVDKSIMSERLSIEKDAALQEKEKVSRYYGVYEIKEYYPGNTESYGVHRLCNLPDEEVDLLIGQRIVLTEDKYVAYDNFRFGGRSGDRELSDYQIKNMLSIILNIQ